HGRKHFSWIENDAHIDLASSTPMEPDCPAPGDAAHGPPPYQRCSVLRIPDGVTLASGRSPTRSGGLLYLDHQIPQRHMLDLGSNTHITGLRLRGYATGDTTDRQDHTSGIQIGGTWYELNPDGSLKTDTTPVPVDHVLIDDNELWGWPEAAIGVASNGTTHDTADHVRITNNFIHD